MNEIRTTPSTPTHAGFRWPSPMECAVIGVHVLLPYLLASILLAA